MGIKLDFEWMFKISLVLEKDISDLRSLQEICEKLNLNLQKQKR